MIYIEIECVETEIDRNITFFAKSDYRSGEWYVYGFDDGSGNLSNNLDVPPAVIEAIEEKLNEPKCYRRKRQISYRKRSCRRR